MKKDIFLLHIDTATKTCSVALSKNGVLVDFIELTEDGYIHGEKLTLFIEEVCQKNAVDLKELSAISVTSGPGSYTGLRIGVSVAKGLCYALEIPMIAIDALLTLAAQGKVKHPGKKLCCMIDARRMEVFSAIYDQDLNVIKEISADVIDEASYAEFDGFIYFGDGAEKVQELWAGRDVQLDSSIYNLAVGHVEIAYHSYQNQDFVDTAYFEPFYLKDFVAGKKKTT